MVATPALPERHLGLLPAAEIADLDARIERMADLLAATAAAALPPPVEFAVPPAPTFPRLLEGQTIAVARDAAFCFLYPANLECLDALGARLEFFSPLADAVLPACDAVWLPGGYPELHGPAIAANTRMAASLRAHVAAHKPLLAECGGMMACFETLHDIDEKPHAMFGLMPGASRMQTKLASLGMLAADLPEGRINGHTFHFSRSETPLIPLTRATRPDGRESEAIYRTGRLTASYMHCYFPSNPAAAARLLLPAPASACALRESQSASISRSFPLPAFRRCRWCGYWPRRQDEGRYEKMMQIAPGRMEPSPPACCPSSEETP